MIEFTERAREILRRSHQAASRFDPDAAIRLARAGGGVEALLAEGPSEGDARVDLGGVSVWVESGLEGVVDVEEPHDRIVLRPPS